MIDAGRMIRSAWELVPILSLLVVGAGIAVRSGVRHLRSRQEIRQVVDNLSHVLLRVVAYAAALLVINQWVGMRSSLGW